MELLQWMNSGVRIVLAGAFALLPGTLVWLSLVGALTVLRRKSGSQALKSSRAGLHRA
jgi:hypothetical protein